MVSQFAKIMHDNTKKTDTQSLYGTVVEHEDGLYVKIDGSDVLTPADTGMILHSDDRVMIDINNHNATVSNNLSNPSISTIELTEAIAALEQKFIDGYDIGVIHLSAEGTQITFTTIDGYIKTTYDGFYINDGENDLLSYSEDGLIYTGIIKDSVIVGGSINVGELTDNNLKSKSTYEADALTAICETPIYSYKLNTDGNSDPRRIGIIADEAPSDTIRLDDMGVDLYQMVSMTWRAIQQINDKLES